MSVWDEYCFAEKTADQWGGIDFVFVLGIITIIIFSGGIIFRGVFF
jgi:hypothetical protein